MAVKYHQHTTRAAADRHLAALRRAGAMAHVVSMNAAHHEVVELYAPATPASAVDAHIGSLADATLEPLTDGPARDGSHVTFDARGVDPWSRTNGR